MKLLVCILLVFSSGGPTNVIVDGLITSQARAREFLDRFNRESAEHSTRISFAEWNYVTDLTDANRDAMLAVSASLSAYSKELWNNVTNFAWRDFRDPALRRVFQGLSTVGTDALPQAEAEEFDQLVADMEGIYSTAKICPFRTRQESPATPEECTLALEPDITEIMMTSRRYYELSHVWKSFRDESGKKMKQKYIRYVELLNSAATVNGFNNAGEMWRSLYEDPDLLSEVERLWNQMKPLYEQLHAYVRRKLIQRYGTEKIKPNGPIPAHLLGDMWGQTWEKLLEETIPHPGLPSVDVTNTIVSRNMTGLQIYQLSEQFYTSMGLKPMPQSFWDHSIFERIPNKEMVCDASAWDFCNGIDYRIKHCVAKTMRDLVTAHHEMGHIQYYLQYSDQPFMYRDGANPAFHEAIGDVLGLSVSTPEHLQQIGLLSEIPTGTEGALNYLYSVALTKLALQPSTYLIDLWRWKVFEGEITSQNMNRKWWELRFQYQGLCPPVRRSENDFDPGAKFHIAANVPYIRYFIGNIIQYQIYKALCEAAGHQGPLYTCDIYQSTEAGTLLRNALKLGSSKPWKEVMRIITRGRTDKMDAQPIVDYFQPLIDWLTEQNRDETLGWTSNDVTICP